jgi:hypothetical protein
MLSSGIFVELNASFNAFFRAVMSLPIDPESSTVSSKFGAGSRPPFPAGTCASESGAAKAAFGENSIHAITASATGVRRVIAGVLLLKPRVKNLRRLFLVDI